METHSNSSSVAWADKDDAFALEWFCAESSCVVYILGWVIVYIWLIIIIIGSLAVLFGICSALITCLCKAIVANRRKVTIENEMKTTRVTPIIRTLR